MTSIQGPEMGQVFVPFGPGGRLKGGTDYRPGRPATNPLQLLVSGCDEEYDPLLDGIVVAIGGDQVTFSLPRSRYLPVVQVTTGWATWLARRTSAYLQWWQMLDAQTRRPLVKARAWSGRVEDSPSVCEVGALIIIWAALLDDLFAGGPEPGMTKRDSGRSRDSFGDQDEETIRAAVLAGPRTECGCGTPCPEVKGSSERGSGRCLRRLLSILDRSPSCGPPPREVGRSRCGHLRHV